MSAALGQLRFTIATLIQGFAPGTALQMLHDAAVDACTEYARVDLEILTPGQRAVVEGDLERKLGEIGTASEAPAAKWNEAHPNEPQVWPTMIMGDGARGKRCQFYMSDLMENPASRDEWFEQADLQYLSAIDPESLEHAGRIVERGEQLDVWLKPLAAPIQWLSDLVAAPPGTGPGGTDCATFDVWCRLGPRGPALVGVGAAVLSLAVLGMFPGPWWTRVLGAGAAGTGAWFIAKPQRGAA